MKKLVSLVLFLFFLSGCEVSSPRRSKSSVKSISRVPIGAKLPTASRSMNLPAILGEPEEGPK